MNTLNDIKNLFGDSYKYPPFVLYDQDELLYNKGVNIAIPFTALNDNFSDILEAQIIKQPLENGDFKAIDINLIPRIIELEAIFIPNTQQSLEAVFNDMNIVQGKLEDYVRNKRTVVIKQHYPNNYLYKNLKIVKSQKVINTRSRGRLHYHLRFEEIVQFGSKYSNASSSDVVNPKNSGVISR